MNPRPLARGIVVSGGTLGQFRYNLCYFLVQFLLGAISGGGRRIFRAGLVHSQVQQSMLLFDSGSGGFRCGYGTSRTPRPLGAIMMQFGVVFGAGPVQFQPLFWCGFLLPHAVRQTPICTAKPPSVVRCAAAVHHLRTIAAPVRLDRAKRSFLPLEPLSKKPYNAFSTCMIMRPGSWPLGAMRWG